MINLEKVSETGDGVYVAVLDTGLVPNWEDYFPSDRVATDLGIGFHQNITFKAKKDTCGVGIELGDVRATNWIGSRGSSHGTHVASTILGYAYRSDFDRFGGYDLGPIEVRGIAPNATVIPVKVLGDYQLPALPKCEEFPSGAQNVVFGTDAMVAAGIHYVTDLAEAGYTPMVINMSLGGPELTQLEQAALDRAIDAGVIVVAAASNDGEEGMDYPGAYPPVISAGSVGWIGEWIAPGADPTVQQSLYRMWWLQHPGLPPGSADVADPTVAEDVYVSEFSSRALAAPLTPAGNQELDVLAPGSWVRGPFPGTPGYNHQPWWSNGLGEVFGRNAGNFYYVGGTSMATPHVASVAALMLEKNPGLVQADVESIMTSTALPLASSDIRAISLFGTPVTVSWDTICEVAVDDSGDPIGTVPCDPVGAGMLLADQALGATLPPTP